MIKVFTTNVSAGSNLAGEKLTEQFNKWVESRKQEKMRVDIVSMHSNSNKFGWMLVIQYTEIYTG